MGKLIVFEGIDGSGKSTQFSLACKAVEQRGRDFTRLVFPRYENQSSALIRMYLGGEFGTDPEAVNPYAASTFYAVDRYASYVQDWRQTYENDGLILTDRYATSNAVHQASKLEGQARQDYFKWLQDFEFGLLQLPAPDLVLFLDVPVEVAAAQRRAREQASGTSGDIHESAEAYLRKCAACAHEAADFYGWRRIACVRDGAMRSVEDIHAEVMKILEEVC